MEEKTATIFNIQKYSIHDGPGIRTVVFFKGCPLRCLWCSNPESQSNKVQVLYDKSKCPKDQCFLSDFNEKTTTDSGCFEINPNEYDLYVKDAKSCPDGAMKIEGKYLTVSEVVNEVLKDIDFYEESGGGVTLSGGEVLQQHIFAKELLQSLKEKNIHTAIETTGCTTNKIFSSFIDDVDLILFDMKHYDRQKHHEATGVYNDVIIENLKIAIVKGKNVIIRIPVIPSINSTLEDARGFCELLNTVGANKVNLLPFHQFGQKKYELLHKDYAFQGVPQLHEEDLLDYQQVFLENGFDCYF
ncbi:glycyl-radical enzyme activating protein [Bacillus massilinigeriensis]|uniref:glycyl-radical enzyme activating protein n=1 Tax=Bacillus massilionigeriensis TaxID=1805475 RepID=UPI00096B2428|nr:glycyl-radical enzyme activating protein [Bacillus massilionigeriensis]